MTKRPIEGWCLILIDTSVQCETWCLVGVATLKLLPDGIKNRNQ